MRRALSSKQQCGQVFCSVNDRPAFWVLPKRKEVLTAALEGNIKDFLFTEQGPAKEWLHLGCFNAVCVDQNGTFEGGLLAQIRSAEDVETLMGLGGTADIVVMEALDWKAIPAENLIAAFQSTPTKLFAVVTTAEDAKAMFGMLQVGVDGCVLCSEDESEVRAFASLKRDLVDKIGQPVDGLSEGRIAEIQPVGVGERVCVDTCSLLNEDEGLLVGSSSQATFLVLSEAAQVDYVPSRPFRVNAGSVHSYCQVPGGKTRYLVELKAGDEVLIAGDGGKTTRTAVVGRAKIETRPLLLIRAVVDDQVHTLFVQNAETVRLAVLEEDGIVTSRSITRLEVGNRLVVKSDRHARHIGLAIEEDLVEK